MQAPLDCKVIDNISENTVCKNLHYILYFQNRCETYVYFTKKSYLEQIRKIACFQLFHNLLHFLHLILFAN